MKVTASTGIIIILFSGICLSAAQSNPWETPSAEATKITKLGGPNAFVQNPLSTVDSLRQFFITERASIESALDTAGWEGSAADLFTAARDGSIDEALFPVGARLDWMALRRGGKDVDILKEVSWQGRAPFEGFVLRLASAGSRWVFVVPKICGNLSLLTEMGADDLTIDLENGTLELVDAEGRPITIQPGGSATVSATYSDRYQDRDVSASNQPTTVKVIEGTVEFKEYRRPVAVMISGGNEVSATLDSRGAVALSVPGENTSDLPIKIGDAYGVLKKGSAVGVQSPIPDCNLDVTSERGCTPSEIIVDASGSSVSGGAIFRVDITATMPDGKTVDIGGANSGFRWTVEAEQPGTFSFDAIVTSDTGMISPQCAAKIKLKRCIPPPPTVALDVNSNELHSFEKLELDASASASNGGQIRQVEIGIYNAARRLVDTIVLSQPLSYQMEFDNPGTYVFRASAIDNYGQRSANVVERVVKVIPTRHISLSLFAGIGSSGGSRLIEAEDGALGGVKLTYDRQFTRNYEVGLGLVAAYDEARSQAAFGGDIVVDRLFGNAFAGLGLGLWDIGHSDNSALDIILRGGFELPFRIGAEATHFFAEGRIVTGEPGGVKDSYRVLAGIRIRPW